MYDEDIIKIDFEIQQLQQECDDLIKNLHEDIAADM